MTAMVGSASPASTADETLRFGPASAFSGYRWPADVILTAVRHPLSATSVMELLAERGIDASNRTMLR